MGTVPVSGGGRPSDTLPETMDKTRLVVVGMVVAALAVLAYTLMRKPAIEPDTEGSATTAAPAIVAGGDVARLSAAPHLLFRHTAQDAGYMHLSIAPLADPAQPRGTTPLTCERISFSAGRGICLQASRGVLTTYEAVIFDDKFAPVTKLKLDGAPSRTRVSPDGRIGTITVFVTGQEHGYSSGQFSTRTTLVDMATGQVRGDLESFQTTRDGHVIKAADFNFWGVTFTRDSRVFYATLMTDKKTYLVRGDADARTLTVLHENVECPSISPNNKLIAFKKRVGNTVGRWRFHVLDLATMADRPLAAEARSIDDQIEWLDDDHVLYATTRSSQSALYDIWVAPVSGTDPARTFIAAADSPAVVR
jgi:hypothetical protein